MAQTYVDTDGTLVIPQANAKWTTAPSNSGLATSGVICLVGEADQGPSYSDESDITLNSFGPNQLAQVQAKYGAGRIVDAYNTAANPSKDPGVRGAPARIFIAKTNTGTKASAPMPTVSQAITLAAVVAADTVQVAVGGITVTFTAVNGGVPGATEFDISGTDAQSATNLAAAMEAYAAAPMTNITAAAVGAVVTLTAPQNLVITTSNPGRLSLGTKTSFATIQAKRAGTPGNVIFFGVTAPTGTRRTVTVTRQSDSKTETFTFGGNVVLSLTAAASTTFVVGSSTITSAGNGALVGALNIEKSSFTTLGDLAAFISSQTGWTATVLPAYKQMGPSVLDQDTYTVNLTAEVKKDAYEFNAAIANSALVEVGGTAPVKGLPMATVAPQFLSGGTRGSTTDANVQSALAALERVRANAIVPLFSQDATADITAAETDNGSTYTIAGINGYATDHVSRMSQFKRRRPRQAYCSFRGSFTNAKLAAQTQAFFRTSMAFEDYLGLSVSGGVKWFQPWMASVAAAGMQMAGFYKPMFNKAIACTGVKQNAADFSPDDDTQVEDALLAGLLVIRQREDGSYAFVSDQTTYSVDENFIYNSIQAIYVADVISVTVAQRMEKAFVGQSFADVTASVAMSYLKAIMADLKKLKLITASDDAVDGYKNAKVEISAPSMLVSAEVKEATGLYFIPIAFLITQVQQSAQG